MNQQLERIFGARHIIITQIEKGKLKGILSLTTILEIRFLLRRKKNISEKDIATVSEDLIRIFDINIPDGIILLQASKLQAQYPLDPFDAILLSLATKPFKLISRDTGFLEVAAKFVSVCIPEDFISQL